MSPRNLSPLPPSAFEVSQKLTGDPYISGSKPLQIDPNTVRGLQTSLNDSDWKDISIGIQDIDESIMYYFREIIKPSVLQNEQHIAVPIIYGSPERWKSVQADGYYRDKNGKMMAPLIMFKRNSIEKNRNLGNKLDGNYSHLFQMFESSYNRKNEYDNFSVLSNRKPSKQIFLSVVPDYVTISYECILFTEFSEQMNDIIESINFASDSYWGDSSKFQFRSRIDIFNTNIELNNGENRAVKTLFNINLNGYIITEAINKKLASTQLIYSPSQVIITSETVVDINNLNTVEIVNKYPGKENNITFPIPISFTIGDGGTLTPLPNTNSYYNSTFFTNKNFTIFVNGYGYLLPTYDFDYINSGGNIIGIYLINGRTFYYQETYVIEFQSSTIQFIVDNSLENATIYNNVNLENYLSPTVFVNGYGYLVLGEDFSYLYSSGKINGFELINGRIFNLNEVYTIKNNPIFQFIVDNSLENLDTYNSNIFSHYKNSLVCLNGYGYLVLGEDFEYIYSEMVIIGISLINGRIFNLNEVYTIELYE